MRLKTYSIDYLTGDRFSNGLRVEFDWDPHDTDYRSRIEWLAELCAGKNVIHAGCVDHTPEQLIAKLGRNKWLHAMLVEKAKRCLGVDKDQTGIAYLRDELGYADVECLNLLDAPGPTITNTKWDYLLLGEVLEHIDNPVSFLGALKERYSSVVAKLLITVPNAFAHDNFYLARRNIEAINTDHRFWFTPYTLCKIMMTAGFEVEQMRFCRNGVIKRRSFIKNAWFRRHPLLRNNIILIAHFQNTANQPR